MRKKDWERSKRKNCSLKKKLSYERWVVVSDVHIITFNSWTNDFQRQSQLEEESQLGYEAAKRLEEEEKRTERQQLEEDERMAELLSQEFIIQQIVSYCPLLNNMMWLITRTCTLGKTWTSSCWRQEIRWKIEQRNGLSHCTVCLTWHPWYNLSLQELTASTSKTYHLNTTSRLKTPKRKTAVHPKCPTHSESPSVKPITFWLKPAKHTVSSPANQ